MVQLLRTHAIFVEDLSSILSTYISDLELPITPVLGESAPCL